MKPLALFAGWILWLVCTVPASLRASVANPEIPDSLKRGACSVVRDYSVEFVQKSATGGEAQFRKTVTVLNAEGLEGATFIHVDGHFSKLKKFKGGISNSQGKQVVKLRRSDLKESTLSSGLTSDSHTYYYECPPYSYPFSVTYEWTCDYSNGMLVYPDFYPQISYNQSVQNASYRLSVPGNVDVIYRSNRIGKTPEVTRHGEYKTYAWTGISLTASHPAYNGDARSVVGYIESEPTVFECDGYEGRQDTWQNFGIWKNKLLQGRDNLPEDEKQKIIAMTRDASSPVEKIRILYDYLARNTRYVSIQLGIGGWQPIDAATVCRTKFGDCKGLTNYMKAMLAVAGIPSVYTCISVEEKRLCPHLPGVHQLDHAILCVPLPADTLWLECTNAYLPFGYVHSDIAGHDAMLVDDNGGRLVRLPDYPDSCHRQSFHTRMQLDIAGNILSVFNPLMKTDANGSEMIWKTPYSQYVKAEVSVGRTWVFGRNDGQAVATRLLAGAGYAYGNSNALPFEKHFYAGGANSLRGWQARAVGPGLSPMDNSFIIPNQTGDMKLEANVEYRFKMFWKLAGAVFIDAGNVWTLRDTGSPDNIPISKFTWKNFGESIAANWGAGIRLDLNFLLLRLDMGMRVHDPARAGNKWLGMSQWLRRGNYAVHFGVGYPF